jgi:hypothetical protein
LFAVIGLRDEEIIDIDAEFAGVDGIESVLGVHEGGVAAGALCLGDRLERHGGFAGGFGAEDFDDAAAREAADAEGGIEREASGGDDCDGDGVIRAEAEDRAFAELLIHCEKSLIDGSAAFCFCHFASW